jgi:MFS family permease
MVFLRRKRAAVDAESFAFKMVLFVVFVDNMGAQFGAPALVPLAQTLNATPDDVGTLYMARAIGALVSGFFLPYLSDTHGRVLAMKISCFGSAIGYILQGLVYVPADPKNGLFILLIGKIVAGLFSGTVAVCYAYITDLSMPNMNTIRSRMGAVTGMSQALGIVLAPIAGAIASFGLELPFLISGGVAAVGYVMVALYLKEAKEVKETGAHKKDDDKVPAAVPVPAAATAASDSGGDSGGDSKAEPKTEQQVRGRRGGVWCDINLIILGVGFMTAFAIGSMSLMFLVPFLLSQPSFGFDTQQQVATAVGVSGILAGILQIITITFVFPFIMKKKWVSDLTICGIGGVWMALPIFFMPNATKLWHIILLNAAGAPGVGFFLGVLMSSPSQYLSVIWPASIAKGRAVYLQILTVGTILGPKLVLHFYSTRGLSFTFRFVGVCILSGLVLVLLAMSRFKAAIARVAKAKEEKIKQEENDVEGKLTKREEQEIESTGAKPVGEFLDQLRDDLAKWLPARHFHLTNGRIQDLVERIIDDSLPTIREYSDEPQGRGHLSDLAVLYDRLGDEEAILAMEGRHPQHAPLLHMSGAEQEQARQEADSHAASVAGIGMLRQSSFGNIV